MGLWRRDAAPDLHSHLTPPSQTPACQVGGILRIAHCGGLHVPQLNKIVDALNFIAKLLHRRIRWDTETLGCVPSLSSIPSMEQRLLTDAFQVRGQAGWGVGECDATAAEKAQRRPGACRPAACLPSHSCLGIEVCCASSESTATIKEH